MKSGLLDCSPVLDIGNMRTGMSDGSWKKLSFSKKLGFLFSISQGVLVGFMVLVGKGVRVLVGVRER